MFSADSIVISKQRGVCCVMCATVLLAKLVVITISSPRFQAGRQALVRRQILTAVSPASHSLRPSGFFCARLFCPELNHARCHVVSATQKVSLISRALNYVRTRNARKKKNLSFRKERTKKKTHTKNLKEGE
jgi:hypothetical protein